MTNDIYNRRWATPTVKPSPINSRWYAVRRTYGFGYEPTVGMTVKPSPINSRGYAARRTYGFGYAVRRTYGNRTTVNGMHAEGVPQQHRWATPSGSMSPITHSVSVGSANPRLLKGDRVAVIRGNLGGKTFVDNFVNFGNFDNFKQNLQFTYLLTIKTKCT